jgi:Effector Associated Constant Component 1
VSDYAQIVSLESWLKSVSGLEVHRSAGSPPAGQMGALDVISVVAGSSGLVAFCRMIPEYLKARRSGLSITATVKGKKFVMSATNIDDIMPVLERFLNE